MARHARHIAVVTDAFGDKWDARDVRSHNPMVAFGWPHGWPRGKGGIGGPRLIPMQSLVAYMEAHLHRGGLDQLVNDLPIGRTTLNRMRRLLGHDYYESNRAWWESRVDDLMDLTLDQFARKHDVTASAAEMWRLRLLGRSLRPAGWWMQTGARDILSADLPRAYIADQLDLSVGSVGRLRWMLKQ